MRTSSHQAHALPAPFPSGVASEQAWTWWWVGDQDVTGAVEVALAGEQLWRGSYPMAMNGAGDVELGLLAGS